MFDISKVRQINFPIKPSEEAILSIYEANTHVPFAIKRVFVINAGKACERGFHAHKKCTQLLVVLTGACLVTCDDSKMRIETKLFQAGEGLLIPPTIWAEQEYETGTILMVLTDSPYEEADYIRSYEDFLSFRGVK